MGEEGQVLGQSCDVNVNCRGFIWQNGVMTDVNALLPAGNKLYVEDANFINAAGEISEDAIDLVSGNIFAIRLNPLQGNR
jgi:probable HAF family extracellular repeat protein